MSLRNKLIRLAYTNPELRDDLLPLLTTKSAKFNSKRGNFIDFGLKINMPMSLGVNEQYSSLDQQRQRIYSIIKSHYKGTALEYYYFVEVQLDPVPYGRLYIEERDGKPMSGTRFNEVWSDVIKALVREKFLDMRSFQQGISTAMRSKAYISDGKLASINDRTIIWEYFGTDYDNEIAYRDDLMMSSFKSFTGAVHALLKLKNEAKKKGFRGSGIRFKRKGQNNMQALVQGSSDQGMGDELFYHHQIKFMGFEGEEMQNMIDIVSKW